MKDILKLNDVQFIVGAESISNQQENLSYRFNTLRENGGTKIASGHGMGITHISIPIVKEDYISLHRFLIQIKRNPFIYLENRLIRHEYVPHWKEDQNMAFTVTNATVQSDPKAPHRLNLSLTLQWFNYKPYADNFVFREDWITEDILEEGAGSAFIYNKTINGIEIDRRPEPVGWKAPDTVKPLKETWAGGYHNQLIPSVGMKKSTAVTDPNRSKIYRRFYNLLQIEALEHNFGINVRTFLNNEAYWNQLYEGTLTLEEALKSTYSFEAVIEKLTEYDHFILGLNIYKTTDIPETLKNTLGANVNDFIEAMITGDPNWAIVDAGFKTTAEGLRGVNTTLLTLEVGNYDKILSQADGHLAIYLSIALEHLVRGETLSGISYDGNRFFINEVARNPKANYGVRNGKSPHAERPSRGVDLNYSIAPYGNHGVLKRTGGKTFIEDFTALKAKTPSVGTPEYNDFMRSEEVQRVKRALEEELMVRIFFIDLAIVCNKVSNGKLYWGGAKGAAKWPIKSGDREFPAEQAVRSHKFKHEQDMAWLFGKTTPFYFADFMKEVVNDNGGSNNQWGLTVDNTLITLFGNSFEYNKMGSDQVHIGISNADALGKYIENEASPEAQAARAQALASKAPITGQTPAVTNKTKSWTEAISLLSEAKISEADWDWLQQQKILINNGWRYYRENSTTGIFHKKANIIVNSRYGKFFYGKEDQNNLNIVFDGSADDFDTILTSFAYSYRHIVTTLPILGSQYPTTQHLGSLDGTYSFEFATQDRDTREYLDEVERKNPDFFRELNWDANKRDGIGITALMLKYAFATLQENGRTIKNIYDSWMCTVDSFITRLTGAQPHNEIFSQDDPSTRNPRDRKLIYNASSTQTVRHTAGLTNLIFELEECRPYTREVLKNTNTNKAVKNQELYKKIIEKMMASQTKVSGLETLNKVIVNNTSFRNNNGLPPMKIVYQRDKNLDLKGQSVNIKKYYNPNYIHRIKEGDYFIPSQEEVVNRLKAINQDNQESYDKVNSFYERICRNIVLANYILAKKENGGIDVSKEDLFGVEKYLNPLMSSYLEDVINNGYLFQLYWLIVKILQPLDVVGRARLKLFFDTFDLKQKFSWDKAYYTVNNWIKEQFSGDGSISNGIEYTLLFLWWLVSIGVEIRAVMAIPFDLVFDAIEFVGITGIFFFIAAIFTVIYGTAEIIATIIKAVFKEYTSIQIKTMPVLTKNLNPAFSILLPSIIVLDLNSIGAFSNLGPVNIWSSISDGAEGFFKRLGIDLDAGSTRFGLIDSINTYIQRRLIDEVPLETIAKEQLTNEFWERNKIISLREVLIEELDRVKFDPMLAAYFGVEEEVNSILDNITIDRNECLNDLWLPEHPIFNESRMTPPDFYYWNMYEDGGAQTIEQGKNKFSQLLNKNVEGISSFMEQMKNGDINKASLTNTYEVEMDLVSFDGSDNIAASDFPTNEPKFGFNASRDNTDKLRYDDNVMPAPPPIGDTVQDPAYNALLKQLQTIELQFGKREGFSKETDEINKFFEDNKIEEFHSFSKPSMKDIAQEAAKDLYSHNRRMQNAIPAFRLYIVEEDNNEDFMMRFDDFHHYNAIKEITFTESREIAGSTAVIVLQNISGVLDGSKRLTIRDVDYLNVNRMPTGDSTATGIATSEARKKDYRDTEDEEAFQSVVLRPGMNIQIRTGYGNNAEMLEVRMSGRITDINKSVNGDLIEIVAQSFGVELEQQMKGMDSDSEDRVFTMTHKLLGALMFEPELMHFGRWEKYQKAQYGEDKSYELDLANYEFSSFGPGAIMSLVLPQTTNQISDWYYYTSKAMTAASELRPLDATGNAIMGLGNLGGAAPIAFVWDVVSAPLRLVAGVWNMVTGSIPTNVRYNSAKLMTKPQDDNIFAPNPKDYLYKPLTWLQKIAGYKAGLSTSLSDYYRTYYDKEIKSVISGKLKMTSEDLEYRLRNVTIWQVFKEMTLRHPGYVFAARPYGKEFRYTMFFGVPSQRYWSKPGSNIFIDRAEAARMAAGTLKTPIPETYKIEPYRGWQLMVRNIFGSWHVDKKLTGGYDDKEVRKSLDKEEINAASAKMKALGFTTPEQQLSYYLEALNYRFEPFRRYHLVTSGRNLCLNTIGLTNYAAANTMAVKYYTDSEKGEAINDYEIVKAHEGIPEEDVKMKTIDYSQCKGKELALRYGIGSLIYEMKQAYTGELLVLGNPRMKPWDIVILVDAYNDMVGPVEIEQIVERISFESGYITEIKPNMVCFANEISSFPILEGVKAIAGNVLKNHEYFKDFDVGNKGLENLWAYANDVAASDASVIGVKDIVRTPLKYAPVIGEFYQLAPALNLIEVVSDLKTSQLTDKSVTNYLQSEIQNKTGIPTQLVNGNTAIAKHLNSGIWLLGGYFYVMQANKRNPIIVYPLIKNGNPFVSVIPSGIPNTIYSIFLGNVSTWLKDVTKGTSDLVGYWQLLGLESLETAGQIAEAVIEDL